MLHYRPATLKRTAWFGGERGRQCHWDVAVCRHLPTGAGMIWCSAGEAAGGPGISSRAPSPRVPKLRCAEAVLAAGMRPALLCATPAWWQDRKICLGISSFQQIKLILQSSCASPLPLEIINTFFSELVLLERPHLLGRPCEIYVCLLI